MKEMTIEQLVQDFLDAKENDTDLDCYRFRTRDIIERMIDCVSTLNFIAEKYHDSDAQISIDRLAAKAQGLE